MKNIIRILFFLASIHLLAQTDGISYQAVIIGPNNQELPGVDAEGNILPNATVSIRFTIMDANNGMEYQEIQTTNTDQYGRINLTIGSVNPDEFTKINWDGTSKDLKVEIDFSGSGSDFIDMSREKLTFLPYGFHRDIKATGKLVVDDVTDLNSELTVGGPTRLNSTLDVNNNNTTNLTGELNVDGITNLKSTLGVDGLTDLNDGLNVNNNAPANFSGESSFGLKATFKGPTAFEEPSTFVAIDVDGPSQLNGKVSINANVDGEGGQNNIERYPLLVQGSNQGIAIKVNGEGSIDNNYISFWDQDSGKMWGRIEGVTTQELENSSNYKNAISSYNWNLGLNITGVALSTLEVAQAVIDVVASSSSSTACVGFGACITAPIPAFIISSGTNLAMRIANLATAVIDLVLSENERARFIEEAEDNIGVSYESGAGDYAEWLPKQNLNELFIPGELVGVKNGLVTKSIWDAENVMIVSTRPIVLGNMPLQNNEKNSVKIAFMGQVPARVVGNVKPGDYILPSELGNGLAKAVHPDNMKTRDYKKIAGVAWSTIYEITNGVSLVNVAVGINANDLSEVLVKQEKALLQLQTEYDALKREIRESNIALANLVPGYAKAVGFNEDSKEEDVKQSQIPKTIPNNFVRHTEEDIVYFDISRDHMVASIDMAREQYKSILSDDQAGKILSLNKTNKSNSAIENMIKIPLEEHPFWQKIDSDPAYKEEIIRFMQSELEKAFHTHQEYAHEFTDMKVKE